MVEPDGDAVSEAVVFGTDGWRARIADGYTFENLRRVAAAAARYYRDEAAGAERGLVIGHDRRFLAREFAEAAAEVVSGHGLPVWLTHGPTPTPVISHGVIARRAAGAINITASHNPATDLGFKVRDHTGAALAPDALARIEARLPAPGSRVERADFEAATADGRIRLFDPAGDYRTYVAGRIDLPRIAAAGLHVAYDPMWGAGIGWLEWLMGPGATTRLSTIHAVGNPAFPGLARPEPIPPNTEGLAQLVHRTGADIGIANDGDADRIGAVDENGVFIDQLQMYGLLAYYLLEVLGERGAIVKTLSTTSMLEALGRRYGVPVHETGVGFKYVGPKMLETGAMIGGEESGGFAFGSFAERDGLLAALSLLDLVIRTKRRPSELLADLYRAVGAQWHYKRIDRRFDARDRDATVARLDSAAPSELAGLPVRRIDRSDGYKFWLPDDNWMLIRFSGTEPLLRMYTETTRPELVDPLLAAGARLAGLDGNAA